jgi:hypothetical protein
VHSARALTRPSARIAGYYTPAKMNNTLQVLQLNAGKRDTVMHSLMNDEQLKDFGIIAVAEPHAWTMNRRLFTSPQGHRYWTRFLPTESRDGRWPIRSMLWTRRDIEAEQVAVNSSDLTAAILRLPGRTVLAVSVYIEGGDAAELATAMKLIEDLIRETRRKRGANIGIILAGDFNRHDQLWGGNDIIPIRQGEADPIIDLMNEFSLLSLLPRGTKTWQQGDQESTIDLILASEELASSTIQCRLHGTEYGSDHRAIKTVFDIETPSPVTELRLLFKNAPWKAIKERITASLLRTVDGGSSQQQADRLMTVVLEAVHALTPKAKPSVYAKRWWTNDLTLLRQNYTYLRNQARALRRQGRISLELEWHAKEAAKGYHDAIKVQKKSHWNEFLADNSNIWQAARYLKADNSAFDKIPLLKRHDGSITENSTEQATELLKTFFPPLPQHIENEGDRPQREAVAMPSLTMEEIERQILPASPWKAPGEDGLPAVVWRHIWPAVKERVLRLFQSSLHEGYLPTQWRNARIIPLKKPDKGNYTLAKAWRPISLLSTLGKTLEAVIAERISYAVETYGLLPTNHFGARKQRSTEQALILLQECIYKAWRSKKVLSLISFDVKGAYNGVCKERLLQRLTARGIPPVLIRWINAFCSERSATILVNGQSSELQSLPQAGLPQGSPLSPILFLFFNADLVQHKINTKGGSIAFVDDYSAWVIGQSADANREGIQTIIDRAIEWEKRSGAVFESDKTTIMHFTRTQNRSDNTPFHIKGETVAPKQNVKILGVIMDVGLRYKEHIAKTATKGLAAAMALRRLRMISPSTARQLFSATVAPVIDYASNVWKHAYGAQADAMINRIQRIGAQAITGTFRTVATAIAEAEADICTVKERHDERKIKLWINIATLPDTNPLKRIETKSFRRFISPLQRAARNQITPSIRNIEIIHAYPIPPWRKRLTIYIQTDRDEATVAAKTIQGTIIATSCSEKGNALGIGGAIHDTHSSNDPVIYSRTLGSREEQNPYTAELAAIAIAMRCMPTNMQRKHLIIMTCNRSALQAIQRPQQQSGQASIKQIYEAAQTLEDRGNIITGVWIPADADIDLRRKAKTAAQQAVQPGYTQREIISAAKSTILSTALNQQRQYKKLPEEIGKFSKEMDVALPGKHTRNLYNGLKRSEASILAQLRTGMARLNGYLYRIGAAESSLCSCGIAKETIRHFIFCCPIWDSQRRQLIQQIGNRKGCLSTALGGKAASDPQTWKPDLNIVKSTIAFALTTGRLNQEAEQLISI